MLNFIKKHWSKLGFGLVFLLDQQTNFLNEAIDSTFWQNNVRLLGSLALILFFNKDVDSVKELIKQKRLSDVGGTNVPPDKDEK